MENLSIPELSCDIVMKGGVTSGIVYPKAMYELSKKYRFVNIGGTSAGAIAAVLTAAAEYRRRETGDDTGFKMLEGLPGELAEKEGDMTKLFSLFKPNPETGKIFKAFIELAKQRGTFNKIFSAIRQLLAGYFWLSIPLLLIGGGIGYTLIINLPLYFSLPALLFTIASVILVPVVTTLIFFVLSFNEKIKENNFGLTTGYVEGEEGSLVEWLDKKINTIAGKPQHMPLTFGDLRNKPDEDERINLKMVATNLTLGIPFSLPFDEPFDKMFLYNPGELKRYFPENIITWLENNSNPYVNENEPGKDTGLRWLPFPDDFPVIVAVRLSLSFPLLFSAVPLYKTGRPVKQKPLSKEGPADLVTFKEGLNIDEENPEPRLCYFSDGGICSNFPVHFFDSPLPRRPTFGLNLRNLGGKGNVYMPESNSEGRSYQWSIINTPLKFFFSIFNTSMEWTDNEYLKLPGYRDRIAHIHIDEEEGGLNLNMTKDEIINISERGREAGQILCERFSASAHPMNWNNHRWIRFRTTMCLLQGYLLQIDRSLLSPGNRVEKTYEELLSIGDTPQIPGYRMQVGQKEFAEEVVSELKHLIKDTLKGGKSLCEKNEAPRPRPELRAKPRL